MSGENEVQTEAPAKKEEKLPKKKKRTAKSLAIEFFIRIAVTAVLITVVLVFVAGVYVNHSNSSYPMIKDGDLCMTLKLKQPEQGDAVAYEHDGGILFGRVIAEGGDVVEIKDGYVAVNGFGLFEDTVYPTNTEGSAIEYPYTVPENTYFILNDFRSDVTDSRIYGGISKDDYKGKVIFLMRRRGF
ncbi:signal peptidase I [Ruminococcus sp.]|uniref:signal peptidase I n=1 Tax=Ruminococcus sp. TaxID=41978 RepID=UPI0025D2EED0|nr:signal peptidase I [Ruminococcus sp.]MBQ8966613.1 signal peptidase I [Ruminococcus sp.]